MQPHVQERSQAELFRQYFYHLSLYKHTHIAMKQPVLFSANQYQVNRWFASLHGGAGEGGGGQGGDKK